MQNKLIQMWLMPLAFTMILIGYLSVWMPGDVAGLRLIGWEVGEWVKFLPAFKQALFSPEIAPPTNRNWFYIPPITLAFSLILWTATWRNSQPETWIVRLLAIPIAFLAVPDIPIIVTESAGQWLIRTAAFCLVIVCVVMSHKMTLLSNRGRLMIQLFLALIGAMLPLAAYQATRWHISDLLQQPIGIGWGLWLNVLGHLLLFILAIRSLVRHE